MTVKTISHSPAVEVRSGAAPDRPWTTIQIGDKIYDARAPKFSVWWDVARMVEQSQSGSEDIRRLEEGEGSLTAEQRQALLDETVMANFGQLHIAVIYGAEDDTGHLRGGFLRRCLYKQDWAELMAQIDDDDSDVDLPDLYAAALSLQKTFEPWFTQRAASMGLPVPDQETKAKSGKAKPPRSG